MFKQFYTLSKKYLILLLCIFAVANLLLYWPGSLYFLNDDFVHIPLTDDGVLFQQGLARPIHELLVRLDLWLWQKQAFGFHITSLLLHAIVAVQIYYLTKTISTKYFYDTKNNAQSIAYLAVVLFLIYPQNTESFTWILGRTPTLSAIFFLVVVQQFFAYEFNVFTYVTGLLFMLLALFTYEQCILFPAVFFLIAVWEQQQENRKAKFIYAALTTFASVLYLVIRKIVTTSALGTYEVQNITSFNYKILVLNFFRLTERLFLNPLAPTYFMYAAIVFTIALVTWIIVKRRSVLNRNGLLFAAILLVLFIPVISLGITIRSYESGRYLYFPAIFLVITMAVYLQPRLREAKTVWLFCCCLLLYWGWGKYSGAMHFKDASNYVKQVETQVTQHFEKNSKDTLLIDTLHVTIHRLPVFRMGFKTGVHWLNPGIDTNKIKILYYYDEFEHEE